MTTSTFELEFKLCRENILHKVLGTIDLVESFLTQDMPEMLKDPESHQVLKFFCFSLLEGRRDCLLSRVCAVRMLNHSEDWKRIVSAVDTLCSRLRDCEGIVYLLKSGM